MDGSTIFQFPLTSSPTPEPEEHMAWWPFLFMGGCGIVFLILIIILCRHWCEAKVYRSEADYRQTNNNPVYRVHPNQQAHFPVHGSANPVELFMKPPPYCENPPDYDTLPSAKPPTYSAMANTAVGTTTNTELSSSSTSASTSQTIQAVAGTSTDNSNLNAAFIDDNNIASCSESRPNNTSSSADNASCDIVTAQINMSTDNSHNTLATISS